MRIRRTPRERSGFRYSAWGGTQRGFDLDADALMDEMNDELLYHGDLNSALRRLMQQGLRDRNGEQLMGQRELLARLRQRREEMLGRYDLGGVYEDVARQLREIVDAERAGIERQAEEAARSAEAPDRAVQEETARHREELDALPPSLADQVAALQQYEWMDADAHRRFDELVEALREQLLASTFRQMSAGMRGMTPEQTAHVKDMLAELNQMLEQRERGEEPDFAGFMSRYGDLFPGNPATLDELLEQMAASMAQMSQLLNAMSAEQRAELQALAAGLMEDLDLGWQMDQLSRALRQAFPNLGWDQSTPFRGRDPLSMSQLPGILDQLGEMDDLEHLLREANQPGELSEVDVDAARDLLGDDAARSLERLAELARMLEEAGLIEQREGRLELTPRGIRAIGQRALADLFRKLVKDRPGGHVTDRSGVGHDPAYEHKPYEWGDPFRLNVEETVKRAIGRSGQGTPVRLSPADFEVDRSEALTRSATVLALDVSLSMPMRDNFLPAKKVAMALQALITSQYPRDYLGLVSFGRVARTVPPHELAEMSWDFEWGTNLHHALALARRMLAHESGTKQIILVTDGEPTAHIEGGEALFEYPPSPRTIEETLKEVRRCTREGIRINVYMLEESPSLRGFVERMMQMNRGRAFFTRPDTLGDYVLVDFLEHRRARRRAG